VGETFEADMDRVVKELNLLWAETGCEMSDIPRGQRRRALELDEEMTHRANAGDLQGARDALRKWKACWVPGGGAE
jgi:hypothetical protein